MRRTAAEVGILAPRPTQDGWRHGASYTNPFELEGGSTSSARIPAVSEPLRLDCETRQSAEASVLAAFGCTLPALREFLTDPSHLAHYEANWKTIPVDFDRFLLQRAYSKLGTPTLPQEFCWFHCTRVPAGTTFEEGILPLGAVAPGLQERLVEELEDEAAQEAVRRAFASKGGRTLHFGHKLSHELHGGPYAILVREVAEHARALGQHDYLGMPEIIEDLCDEVQAECGMDLLPIFEERWRPAIVKFVAPANAAGEFALAVALRYLRALELEGAPDRGAVWCFDGENQVVPRERILKVEFV